MSHRNNFSSINWQGMIDDGSGESTIPNAVFPSERPWRPQQPSQLHPFRPNRPPRVDNSNQPWYGSRNRSWGYGASEVSLNSTAHHNSTINAVTENPVTGQTHSTLNQVWTALGGFFNSLHPQSLKVTARHTSPSSPLPVDDTQAGQKQVIDGSNITTAMGGIYG